MSKLSYLETRVGRLESTIRRLEAEVDYPAITLPKSQCGLVRKYEELRDTELNFVLLNQRVTAIEKERLPTCKKCKQKIPVKTLICN